MRRPTLLALIPALLALGGGALGARGATEEAGAAATAREVDKVVVALGDIETVETLNFLIAMEHVKEKGIDVELVSFKSEDVANQAIVNGQAQIGIGTPYALIQNVNAPIRLFMQLSTLQFYPVVNTEFYQDWKDLDGQEMVVHSRASGTEAIANLMAQRHEINYSSISYVPGAEVRALALLQGNVKATFLDSFNTEFVMKEAPGRFKVLPMEGVTATDEALFAHTDFLRGNPNVVRTFIQEVLTVWREINANPSYALEQREKYGLLPDLPAELEPEILPYYEAGAESGMFPEDGGGEEVARLDLEFYTVAGQLAGPAESLKVEDFWYLEPLNAALQGM